MTNPRPPFAPGQDRMRVSMEGLVVSPPSTLVPNLAAGVLSVVALLLLLRWYFSSLITQSWAGRDHAEALVLPQDAEVIDLVPGEVQENPAEAAPPDEEHRGRRVPPLQPHGVPQDVVPVLLARDPARLLYIIPARRRLHRALPPPPVQLDVPQDDPLPVVPARDPAQVVVLLPARHRIHRAQPVPQEEPVPIVPARAPAQVVDLFPARRRIHRAQPVPQEEPIPIVPAQAPAQVVDLLPARCRIHRAQPVPQEDPVPIVPTRDPAQVVDLLRARRRIHRTQPVPQGDPVPIVPARDPAQVVVLLPARHRIHRAQPVPQEEPVPIVPARAPAQVVDLLPPPALLQLDDKDDVLAKGEDTVAADPRDDLQSTAEKAVPSPATTPTAVPRDRSSYQVIPPSVFNAWIDEDLHAGAGVKKEGIKEQGGTVNVEGELGNSEEGQERVPIPPPCAVPRHDRLSAKPSTRLSRKALLQRPYLVLRGRERCIRVYLPRCTASFTRAPGVGVGVVFCAPPAVESVQRLRRADESQRVKIPVGHWFAKEELPFTPHRRPTPRNANPTSKGRTLRVLTSPPPSPTPSCRHPRGPHVPSSPAPLSPPARHDRPLQYPTSSYPPIRSPPTVSELRRQANTLLPPPPPPPRHPLMTLEELGDPRPRESERTRLDTEYALASSSAHARVDADLAFIGRDRDGVQRVPTDAEFSIALHRARRRNAIVHGEDAGTVSRGMGSVGGRMRVEVQVQAGDSRRAGTAGASSFMDMGREMDNVGRTSLEVPSAPVHPQSSSLPWTREDVGERQLRLYGRPSELGGPLAGERSFVEKHRVCPAHAFKRTRGGETGVGEGNAGDARE
ncbi:hypothetical protein B0H16DRAFT_1822146 [Mycena metata]|uniref:Uncharacterized protein n=1 Tax=Mycena metata TaxID=1033252 RepID=A0AAD7H0J4_9AGAR|nr:hypothetical protein B0H16DRAFT_1822146 [Mycena metata]